MYRGVMRKNWFLICTPQISVITMWTKKNILIIIIIQVILQLRVYKI